MSFHPILNAASDVLLAASLFYVAYGLRARRILWLKYTIMGLLFLVTAVAFVSNLTSTDFLLIVMTRTIIFTILFVESLRYAIKGLEKIRLGYLLYAAIPIFVLSTDIPVQASRVVVTIVSYLIVATAFAFLLSFKKAHYIRLPIFAGLVGSVYPLLLVAFDYSVIFSPQTAFITPTKILLAIFFLGCGYYTLRDHYSIYDHKLVNKKK